MSELSFYQTTSNLFEDDIFAVFEKELSCSSKTNQTLSNSNHSSNSNMTTKNVPQQEKQEDTSDSDEFKLQKNSSFKRKLFTKKEDELLTSAAITFKYESWNKIAMFVPGKTPKQCRDRWVNYLQPSLNFEPWSNNEDQLLVSLVNKYGTHWTKMKKNFPNRSSNSIKNRWYWLLKNNINAVPVEKFINYGPNNYIYNQFQMPIDNNQISNNNNGDLNFENTSNNNISFNNSNLILPNPTNSQKYYYFLRNAPPKEIYEKMLNIKNKTSKKASNNSIQKNNTNQNNNFDIFSNDFWEEEIMNLNIDEYEW